MDPEHKYFSRICVPKDDDWKFISANSLSHLGNQTHPNVGVSSEFLRESLRHVLSCGIVSSFCRFCVQTRNLAFKWLVRGGNIGFSFYCPVISDFSCRQLLISRYFCCLKRHYLLKLVESLRIEEKETLQDSKEKKDASGKKLHSSRHFDLLIQHLSQLEVVSVIQRYTVSLTNSQPAEFRGRRI